MTLPRALVFISAMILMHAAAFAAENDYQKAKRLFGEGKYEEALRHHVSFHDNILKTDPAMYGVRLSFALVAWVELGQKYPEALVALKEIRDKKAVRLAGGEQNYDLFHDIQSINRYLGDEAVTVAVFKTIEGQNPTFARKIYERAEDALVHCKEYTLARKYMDDPERVFEDTRKLYEGDKKWAESNSSGDTSSFRNNFARRVVALITILQKTGDKAKAKEIQTQALKIVDDDRIRSALRD